MANATHTTAAPRATTSATRKFGFWSIVLLTINGIIGTGIFLSPAGVIKTAGTWTPLIYILAGVFAAILAVVFAAAAKYVNTNGASYAYAHAAFGADIGFYVGITRFVAGAIAWGVMATAVIRTTLGIFGGKAAVNDTNITIGFLVLMLILLAINLGGTYITRWFNDISTVGKVLALVVAILAGLAIVVISGQNHFNDINSLTDASGKGLLKPMDTTLFVGAMLAAFYAYTGFESAATAASEFENPEKNLPKAIPLAIGVVTLIYVGVVTIAMMVNPVAVLKSADPVVLASAFDDPILRGIIVLGALVSMFGINVAASFSTPRVFDALASRGQVPEFFCRKNGRGVPVFAFAITALLAVVIPMAFQYDMKGIMVISSVSRFVQFLVVPLAVIAFFYGRSANPVLKANKNLVTDVVFPIIGFAASVFLMVKFDWASQFAVLDAKGAVTADTNWWAVGAMLIGYIALPIALYIPYKMGLYKSKES